MCQTQLQECRTLRSKDLHRMRGKSSTVPTYPPASKSGECEECEECSASLPRSARWKALRCLWVLATAIFSVARSSDAPGLLRALIEDVLRWPLMTSVEETCERFLRQSIFFNTHTWLRQSTG